jgi:hypothetical protein
MRSCLSVAVKTIAQEQMFRLHFPCAASWEWLMPAGGRVDIVGAQVEAFTKAATNEAVEGMARRIRAIRAPQSRY